IAGLVTTDESPRQAPTAIRARRRMPPPAATLPKLSGLAPPPAPTRTRRPRPTRAPPPGAATRRRPAPSPARTPSARPQPPHHASTSLERQPQADLAPKAILHLTRHPLPQLTSTHLQHLHQLQVLQPPPEPKGDSAAQLSVRCQRGRATQRSRSAGAHNSAFEVAGATDVRFRETRGRAGGAGGGLTRARPPRHYLP